MKNPRKQLLLLLAAVASVATLAVGRAQAITNGQLDGSGHLNVGVMVVDFGSGPQRLCSGELIAPTQFLTAAHCTSFLANDPSPLVGVTFDPSYDPNTSTVIPATAVTVDPQFNFRHEGDFHDLGVITLATPVAATPVVLPTAGLLDQLAAQGGLHGRDFTNVGYGATGFAFGGGMPQLVDFDQAVRRISTSPFQSLQPNVLLLQGNTAATGQGGTCGGDSGSASYLNVGGVDVAVAIVTLRSNTGAMCVAADAKYRLDTPSARAFLGQFVSLP